VRDLAEGVAEEGRVIFFEDGLELEGDVLLGLQVLGAVER
jgi:hypothetical protein